LALPAALELLDDGLQFLVLLHDRSEQIEQFLAAEGLDVSGGAIKEN
jgi:hypothetical protein